MSDYVAFESDAFCIGAALSVSSIQRTWKTFVIRARALRAGMRNDFYHHASGLRWPKFVPLRRRQGPKDLRARHHGDPNATGYQQGCGWIRHRAGREGQGWR
ncbi:MAG: hypothetical protein IPJ01_12890 [Micavibrio sp.]|nr:hypothetical protein [Micavibrio sp.]